MDAHDDTRPGTPDNDGNSVNNGASTSHVRRACDGCRTRKIRCDRNSPCSHCLQVNIPCTHNNLRTQTKRTRILLSSQYEKKIDLLDKRLEEVTLLLQNRSPNPVPSAPPSTSEGEDPARLTPTLTPTLHATNVENIAQSSDSPIVEGESSLAAHSAFAGDFLRNAVDTQSPHYYNIDLSDTLHSLHRIINNLQQPSTTTEMVYPNAKPSVYSPLQNYELPPIQKTVTLIQAAKSGLPGTLSWLHEICPMEHFSDLCLRVYFSKDFSEAEFIIANAGLLYLFGSYARHSPDDKSEIPSFIQMCRTNLETALITLPLHLPMNTPMVFALILGAAHAIEISKPSLAWTLISKASELCQTLGFHRLAKNNANTSDSQQREVIFWSVYFMDKSLSLRLGRASTIPDWDITLPFPTAESLSFNPLLAPVCQWIRTARCQGNIYEMLYSPDAISQPDHVRQSRVQNLAHELNDIMRISTGVNMHWIDEAKKKFGVEFANFIATSDDIICLSLLTLVYRASPPLRESSTQFIPECIEAARRSLQRHQDCMAIIKTVHSTHFPVYVNWILLFAPFIPFIVLFCYVVETQSQVDLDCLSNFISSMESAPAVSEAAMKMIHLFRVLFNAASQYVEIRIPASTDQSQARERLQNYMVELGLPVTLGDRGRVPSGTGRAQNGSADQATGDGDMSDSIHGQGVVDHKIWMGNIAHLEEWFNSSHQMMELVSEPSFGLQPNQRE